MLVIHARSKCPLFKDVSGEMPENSDISVQGDLEIVPVNWFEDKRLGTNLKNRLNMSQVVKIRAPLQKMKPWGQDVKRPMTRGHGDRVTRCINVL